MATYTVNMSNVQEIATQMGAISKYIQNLLTELDDGTKQNLAEWTSDAQQAYAVAKAIWDQKAQDMAVQAVAAQNSLSQINDTYANAEYQGLGLWSR
ncbi:WXG100 family type VII secretion target [Catenulispora sp. NF23]|uniref:WXG100 family type VII secretion target n=1 Tax=Catenulispora pinistramenti TaxID=2705254 RepID=A0ABS5L5J6_9ACTN|nr:WXG100 family type VII secretion target [Catenulispora pinistramenti]MBS2539425.1 WXG100 family type VII secretion target [Catenulispora pinistramenti]MBS2553608.1 WXG100 family type VII secretion target [Catenulispora pinistramenti]